MGPISCAETLVSNNESTLCNSTEEQRLHLHRGGSVTLGEERNFSHFARDLCKNVYILKHWILTFSPDLSLSLSSHYHFIFAVSSVGYFSRLAEFQHQNVLYCIMATEFICSV
jgi:hypothetical protein